MNEAGTDELKVLLYTNKLKKESDVKLKRKMKSRVTELRIGGM